MAKMTIIIEDSQDDAGNPGVLISAECDPPVTELNGNDPATQAQELAAFMFEKLREVLQ